ncbi:MAG: hypothetical protein JO097_16310, partial [Acidobacteriaceae bacterium]|nr:hypothetical protein [Acidobacteriaceae bacterium]
MTSDDVSFFTNLAVIGGTLLALSFVTLQFFLTELLKRYENTALAVFRIRDSDPKLKAPDNLPLPHSLEDWKLFDGDPLVVFMAYSVAVTWIQFLIPLTIGLTTAWLGIERFYILAIELGLLSSAFWRSFSKRNSEIERLNPYLTVEERWWPELAKVVVAIYALATLLVAICAVGAMIALPTRVTFWNELGVSNADLCLSVLKIICIIALLLGTYTTNKDLFVFFKSISAERMRLRWLHIFIRDRYEELKRRVEIARFYLPTEKQWELEREWNSGYPELMSNHAVSAHPEALVNIWHAVIKRR